MENVKDDIRTMKLQARDKQKELRAKCMDEQAAAVASEFDSLKLSALSVDDVTVWLQTKSTQLQEVFWAVKTATLGYVPSPSNRFVLYDINLDKVADCAVSPTVEAFTSASYDIACSQSPEIEDTFEFLGAIPVFPTLFAKDITGRSSGQWDLILYADDWPFVAARNVFTALKEEANPDAVAFDASQNRGIPRMVRAELSETPPYRRILTTLVERHFPGIEPTLFLNMADSGLLPEDIEEFTTWMLQYRQRVQPQPGLSVPSDLS